MKDMISDYPYSQHDLLESPEKYQKSAFYGLKFLKLYKENRLKFINSNEVDFSFSDFIDEIEIKPNSDNEIILEFYLISLIKKISNEITISHDLDLIIKKFEITKKLFTKYDQDFKSSSSQYDYLKNYILLSTLCLLYYEKFDSLKHLNTSIKLNDILCSKYDSISKLDKPMFVYQLKRELKFIEELCKLKNIEI